MSYRERTGILLLADISGYTEYLKHDELEHAQAIITQLLEAIIDAADEPFELVKLEGDAVFLVCDACPGMAGAVADNVQAMFRAFHRRQREVEHATTCVCAGCTCACKMTLKFVGHVGTFGEHQIHGLRELIGPAVVLVHRLLKNTVPLSEYALFTKDLVDELGTDRPEFSEHTERYDHVGVVATAVWDLQPLCEGFHRARGVAS